MDDDDFIPPARGRMEMAYAHDLLTTLLCDQRLRDQVLEPGEGAEIKAAIDTLCWCLRCGHHSARFGELLERIRETLFKLGFVLIRSDCPDCPEEE